MFSEKNIPKLIILTPIVTVILIAFFTIYFFIQNQNSYFEEESQRSEKEYILKQKNILKKEVDSVIFYLNYHTNKKIDNIKDNIKNRLEDFIQQLEVFYKNKNIDKNEKNILIKNMLSLNIKKNNFYFAYDISEDKFINKSIKQIFLKEDKIIKNYLYPGNGRYIILKNKIIYIKYIRELNWIIGTIEDTKESLKHIQNDMLKYIEELRYENNGYIWIHDTSYTLVAHPFRQDKIGTYDIELKDATGTLITKKFIDITLKKPLGVFIEYNWVKPNENSFSKKLGFFKLYENFSWVIGAGLYIDDIENKILENKILLEKRIDKYINLVIIISCIIILIIGFLSVYVSNRINKVFTLYKKKVKTKELLLKNLNENLEKKVKIAIKESKYKDRAMLHQSRLARMGVMLSMIAHQWRQPLSKVSAILMQLETANKFNEANSSLIQSSVNESNKLLFYMSNTIDDFRNFFKPDKKKVDFYIKNTCEEVISLTSASISALEIEFIKDINVDIRINGYEREFTQVILNLITNAKDALVERKIKNPKIILSVKQKNDYLFLCIQDNANGVKEEDLDLIFEPYFTTKGSLQGTGLGLYMSKMIIEKNMQGQLDVENINNGARFCIKIKV